MYFLNNSVSVAMLAVSLTELAAVCTDDGSLTTWNMSRNSLQAMWLPRLCYLRTQRFTPTTRPIVHSCDGIYYLKWANLEGLYISTKFEPKFVSSNIADESNGSSQDTMMWPMFTFKLPSVDKTLYTSCFAGQKDCKHFLAGCQNTKVLPGGMLSCYGFWVMSEVTSSIPCFSPNGDFSWPRTH